ncbi:MAG TPA: sodium-dependent transporter [Candidatus Krumholzibacteria bacterium]|nr:sodium-dependent transporter [Candidatus Krumholzibacteria bacterium]HRX51609.1 sodium-dependent transporter [Candidatus Krumholzibacteria bacterium]
MAQNSRGQWNSSLGFVLAAAGSAIGLGNLWKFPYITYENHGGAFVLVYIAAIALVGLPIMLAEIVLGRKAQRDPVGSFRILGQGRPGGGAWAGTGFLGVVAGFVILSYYSVIAGWTIRYVLLAVSGGLGEMVQAGRLDDFFGAFLADGPQQSLYHTLFMGLTVGVVYFGVKDGIERVAKVLVPFLFAILGALAIYSTTTAGFGEAMTFLFRPNFAELEPGAILEALGHSFFTLSLGMGAMLTYGSYMRGQDSIPRAAVTISVLDTLIALLACVIMFSVIFTEDMEVRKSSTILFTTLPQVFCKLPGGSLINGFFYLLVALAALTSTISLLEVVTSYAIDELKLSRHRAVLLTGGAIYVFGLLNAWSLGGSAALTEINLIGRESTAGVLGTLDYLASNWFLPVGGFLIAVFAGWAMLGSEMRREVEQGHGPFRWFTGWRILLRFVAPLVVGAIIVSVILGAEYQ